MRKHYMIGIVLLIVLLAACGGGGGVNCTDADQDGFFIQIACDDPPDCDDDPATGFSINPAADEICDGIDNDCDELIDDANSIAFNDTNCGGCGFTCAASESCDLFGLCSCTVQADCDGLPGYTCVVGTCLPSS